MSKDLSTTMNKLEEESLFAIELEEPFFAFGRDKLWFSVKDETPELVLAAQELICILSADGEWQLEEDSVFYKEIKDGKISKLVLTFGRYESEPFADHYEIGFYDGKGFRSLNGYRIYPPPTHWVGLPKPPRSID